MTALQALHAEWLRTWPGEWHEFVLAGGSLCRTLFFAQGEHLLGAQRSWKGHCFWMFWLDVNPCLSHTVQICRTRTVSHVGSDGSTMAQRIAAAGFTSYPQAENVAGGQRSALEVAADWMCSSGHRANLMVS
jgi:hypothetical protein